MKKIIFLGLFFGLFSQTAFGLCCESPRCSDHQGIVRWCNVEGQPFSRPGLPTCQVCGNKNFKCELNIKDQIGNSSNLPVCKISK